MSELLSCLILFVLVLIYMEIVIIRESIKELIKETPNE